MLHRSPIELILLPLAVCLGVTAAVSSSGIGGLVGLCGLVALGIVITLPPRKALACAFCMVMLAETKFRMGSPGVLLADDVDSPMLFEILLYSAILLVVVLNYFSSACPSLTPTGVEWALFGYALLALLSSFWAADVRITAVRSVQLCIVYTLCFVGLRVLGPQHLLRLLTTATVCYVLLFTFLMAALPWADGTQFTQTTHMPRLTWFTPHPIATAAYAGTAALLLATEGLFAPGAWRRRLVGLPLWLPLIPLVLVLLATRSRGAILAFLVTLAVLGCRRYVNPWVVGCLGYGLLALSAMSLGLGFAWPASVQKILSDAVPGMAFLLRGQAMGEFLSLNGPTELWPHVHALFLAHPFSGYGYLASRGMLQGRPWAGEAHNALAASLLDVGVIGTALVWFALMRAFFSSLLGMLRISGTGGWQHASVFGALLFLVLQSLVDPTFAGTPGYHVLLLFATVLAHNRLTQERWSGIGTLEAGAWQWSSALSRLRAALLVWACFKRAVASTQKPL
jgi:O-antigen ligase/polysaccharide polymerase Wzy-like membrane protein